MASTNDERRSRRTSAKPGRPRRGRVEAARSVGDDEKRARIREKHRTFAMRYPFLRSKWSSRAAIQMGRLLDAQKPRDVELILSLTGNEPPEMMRRIFENWASLEDPEKQSARTQLKGRQDERFRVLSALREREPNPDEPLAKAKKACTRLDRRQRKLLMTWLATPSHP